MHKTKLGLSLTLLASLFFVVGAAATEPTNVGALTLEPHRAAWLFLAVPTTESVRRGTLGRTQPSVPTDPYDRELSDSFTRHDAARASVVEALNPVRPIIKFSAPVELTTRSVAAPAMAAEWSFSVPNLAAGTSGAPAVPSFSTPESPLTTATANTFAADMLAAPARTRLADEARATWLAPDVTDASTAWSATPLSRAQLGSRPVTTPFVEPQPAAGTGSLLRSWGFNGDGQLGDGTTTKRTSPVVVSPNGSFTGTNITAVATGGSHSLAIQGGVVYAWGINFQGELGTNLVPSDESLLALPVNANGGFTNTATTAITAGASHSVAIQGGAVYAWGGNTNGQLGNNSTTQSNVPVAVSSANGFTNTGVTAISAGGNNTLALQGGVVYAWGDGAKGQLGNGMMGTGYQSAVPVLVSNASGFTNLGVSAIASGYQFSLAIRNGAVYGWGTDSVGQLGNGAINSTSAVPVAAIGLSTGVTSIAAGKGHSLAVQSGNVFAWGDDTDGELGNGTVNGGNATPTKVSYNGAPLSGIVQVAAGNMTSYALAGNGNLYVWGANDNGQLGLGTSTTYYTTPQLLTPPSGEYYELLDSDGDGIFALALLGSTPPVVPEPATWLGGALLLAATAWTRRRRR